MNGEKHIDKLMILLVVLVCLGMPAFAHNGKIKGIVTFKSNGESVQGASVLLREKMIYASTDAFGQYQFDNLEDGNYQVIISVIGFLSDSIQVQVKKDEVGLSNLAQVFFNLFFL